MADKEQKPDAQAQPASKLEKVKLTAPHKHAGRRYAAGETIEVTAEQAALIRAAGAKQKQ